MTRAIARESARCRRERKLLLDIVRRFKKVRTSYGAGRGASSE